MVERIRLLLETRQFTPTQFADAIGVARPIVSHILSGRNKPSLEVVQRILAAMPDLSMLWLLNGLGPMQAAAAAPPVPAVPPQAVLSADNEITVAPAPPVAARARISAAPGPGGAPLPLAPVPASQPGPNRFEARKPEPTPAPATKPEQLPPVVATPVQSFAQTSVAGPGPTAPAASSAATLLSGAEKPIRRIVIFYRDGSFADYHPE